MMPKRPYFEQESPKTGAKGRLNFRLYELCIHEPWGQAGGWHGVYGGETKRGEGRAV